MSEPMPVLSRVERLDMMIGHMEEMRERKRNTRMRDSCASAATTTSSGTTATSDGGNSSVNSSPKSTLEKQCRPMDAVVVEARVKGNLLDRVHHLERRLLELEQDIEKEKRWEEAHSTEKKHRKGLKSLVKSCVKGGLKTKG